VTGLFFIALWEFSRYDRLSSIFRLVVILKMSVRKNPIKGLQGANFVFTQLYTKKIPIFNFYEKSNA